MRLRELLLNLPGEQLRFGFHDQLTVLSGLGAIERAALADTIIGATVGTTDAATLVMVDHTGQRIELISDGRQATAHYDDGSPAPVPLGRLARDRETLRRLMHLAPADLGLEPVEHRRDEPPELADARSRMRELRRQLDAGVEAHRRLDDARAELADVEARIAQIEADSARRAYAKVLSDLERVRAEAAAVQSGVAGADADRQLLDALARVEQLGQLWHDALADHHSLASQLGGLPPVDAQTRSVVADVPGEPPPNLAELLDRWMAARAERDDLEARLHELGTSRLPEPSDPVVLRLAGLDQDGLWDVCRRSIAADERLEGERLELGAVDGPVGGPSGVTDEIATQIEAAHAEVLALEASLKARFGLRHRLERAKAREEAALARAGSATYLAFHLRRVEAIVDPRARDRLDIATVERRLALAAWIELAGDVAPARAIALEAEVRACAAALAALGGVADELAGLRHQLDDVARPAVEAATQALVDVCRPFGLDRDAVETGDAGLIRRLVERQVDSGRTARLQLGVEEASNRANGVADQLDQVLQQLGFGDGPLEARLGAVGWAAEQASNREGARRRARPMTEIEADLAELNAQALRLHRPEWGEVTAAEADGPDLATLQRRRDDLRERITLDPAATIDIDLLSDRLGAVERRVAALESQLSSVDSDATIRQLADLQQNLLAHLTQAAHCGPDDEPVPIVLDDAFAMVPAERKRELLDMLHRLSEKTQLVYLTDDPFVGAWARRRSSEGLITLLEPVDA